MKTAKRKRPTVKAKLEALKQGVELPVDPRALAMDMRPGEYPDMDEKAVLQLASAIHEAESDGAAVSWSAQERAAAYFNQHGLIATLDEMFRLEAAKKDGA